MSIIQNIGNEADYLFAIGLAAYIKDKVSDIGWAVENALGLQEAAEGSNGAEDGSDDTEIFEETDDDDLAAEADNFINGHMSEMQEIIVRAVKQVSPSGYSDQQTYLKDAFDRAADACGAYIQDIFNDPAVGPALSGKITEMMVKDTAVIVAMVMFIEWALNQKPDNNSGIRQEEEA